MADSDDPVIIGCVFTVVIIGLIGGITLSVFLCLRWRDYKRHQLDDPALRLTRRRRTIRVHFAADDNANHSNLAQPPPPYSEEDPINPPHYHANLGRIHQNRDPASRRHTIGPVRIATLARASRSSVGRNSVGSVHVNTGSSNRTSMTPAAIATPTRSTRRHSLARNSLFSVHINTDSTPSMTQTGRMVLNAQRLSISSQGRVNNENHLGNVTE